jgi:hypothetical protein
MNYLPTNKNLAVPVEPMLNRKGNVVIILINIAKMGVKIRLKISLSLTFLAV